MKKTLRWIIKHRKWITIGILALLFLVFYMYYKIEDAQFQEQCKQLIIIN